METKARYSLIGMFTLAVIAAGFAFVYWLEGSGGFQQRAIYRVEFKGSVAGLNVGAGVLFNGVRVGEVIGLRLDPAQPKRVETTIAIASATPVRADTRVGIDYQGITGVPTVSLTGGDAGSAALEITNGITPLLIAADDGSASLTQSARQTLSRLDGILADNAEPLEDTIANI
ncbi:MAG: MlaD family protein, partial [Hyphomicrobiales bacterium]|nr:MlaD family protein [Hyphomicrobiales bacterium]